MKAVRRGDGRSIAFAIAIMSIAACRNRGQETPDAAALEGRTRFDKALAAVDAKGPVNHDARVFVAALLDWVERHDGKTVDVRFQRPSKESHAALASAQSRIAAAQHLSIDHVANVAAACDDRELDSHERAFTDVLDAAWKEMLGSDYVRFTRGVTYFSEDVESAPIDAPTLFVRYDLSTTDAMFRVVRSGVHLMPALRHDLHARFRVPGSPLEIGADLQAVPPSSLSFETDALRGSIAIDPTYASFTDEPAYEAMAKANFTQLERALRAKLVPVPPEPAPPSRASRLLSSCKEKRDEASCVELAEALIRGDDGPKDPATARSLLEMPCILGYAEACMPYADLQMKGEGGERTWAGASVSLEFGCHLEHVHRIDEPKPDPKYGGLTEEEHKKARPAHAECFELHADMRVHASNVADYAPPDDKARFDEYAEADYSKACALGRATACVKLAKHDKAHAKELYAKACEAGDASSCPKGKR